MVPLSETTIWPDRSIHTPSFCSGAAKEVCHTVSSFRYKVSELQSWENHFNLSMELNTWLRQLPATQRTLTCEWNNDYWSTALQYSGFHYFQGASSAIFASHSFCTSQQAFQHPWSKVVISAKIPFLVKSLSLPKSKTRSASPMPYLIRLTCLECHDQKARTKFDNFI